jgi:hypothetical protein
LHRIRKATKPPFVALLMRHTGFVHNLCKKRSQQKQLHGMMGKSEVREESAQLELAR